MFGASPPAVTLLLKFHLICAQVLSVQILMRAFRWLFFFLLFLVRVASRYNEIHTPVHVCVCVACISVCVCVCDGGGVCACHKHIWLGLFVCMSVFMCVCVCYVCLLCSKVSHLSRRWLRVANGRLDRWVHCSTLAAVASAQATASPARWWWWWQSRWEAEGLTTLFWWQNDCSVRFTTTLAFFGFVSFYWEV